MKRKQSFFYKKFKLYIADNSSPTHLYIRPKEVELDVDLLDKYDSFYDTTKSLLVLFQIMGIMPIQRSPKGKKSLEKLEINCYFQYVYAMSF